MINILLPMAAPIDPAQGGAYPAPLTEILGKPMIQRVIDNLSTLGHDCRFIFVVRGEDCRRFHLDSTLELLAPGRCEIVKLEGETHGSLCSALMAINHINNDDPLIVSNSDQLFEGQLTSLFESLSHTGSDAGCIYFDSVHPRWSYVRLVDGLIVEAAEKNPISRHAIAGFYYFASGEMFVDAAMRVILNQRMVDGRYFVAPVFNELVLDGRKLSGVEAPAGSYVSFYTRQRIDDYEQSHR